LYFHHSFLCYKQTAEAGAKGTPPGPPINRTPTGIAFASTMPITPLLMFRPIPWAQSRIFSFIISHSISLVKKLSVHFFTPLAIDKCSDHHSNKLIPCTFQWVGSQYRYTYTLIITQTHLISIFQRHSDQQFNLQRGLTKVITYG